MRQSLRPNQGVWELRQGNTVLGILTINQLDSDFPWYGCDFTPTSAIEPFRQLFDQEWEANERLDWDASDAALVELQQKGIVLVYMEDGEVTTDYLLHLNIDGKKGWFRC